MSRAKRLRAPDTEELMVVDFGANTNDTCRYRLKFLDIAGVQYVGIQRMVRWRSDGEYHVDFSRRIFMYPEVFEQIARFYLDNPIKDRAKYVAFSDNSDYQGEPKKETPEK